MVDGSSSAMKSICWLGMKSPHFCALSRSPATPVFIQVQVRSTPKMLIGRTSRMSVMPVTLAGKENIEVAGEIHNQ
jgi:hypothetical protein